mmetsp:Transcript_25073/g.40262  ORF Transcript_25073/g.40262 Transcript_25073/m.40262 type:complete len:102 (+) Transcript_25073:961-1266(+)
MHSVTSVSKNVLRQVCERPTAAHALCVGGSQNLNLHCKDAHSVQKPKLISEVLHFKPNRKRGRKPDPEMKRMTGRKMLALGKKVKDIGRVALESHMPAWTT